MGLSVGAYGAAVVSGAIAFDDALKLVHLRAKLMEDAYPRGYGMLAVLGLNESEIAQVIADSGADAYIGNLNAPRQIVVSSSDAALECVSQLALERGARKAERLAVSVPSHCMLLEDARRASHRCREPGARRRAAHRVCRQSRRTSSAPRRCRARRPRHEICATRCAGMIAPSR